MIEVSSAGLAAANAALFGIKNGFPRAAASALNRTIEGVRTDITRETTAKYHVKSGDIRKTIRLGRAGQNRLTAEMVSVGSRRSLADYRLTPKTPRRGAVLRGAVKKTGDKSLGGAFLVRRGSRYLPYIRTGRGRWNIEPLISPSIPQILKNKETAESVQREAQFRFEQRLSHEVERLIRGYGK